MADFSHIVSRQYRPNPAACCEACVFGEEIIFGRPEFGRRQHADWCGARPAIDVLVPGLGSTLRAALASCAIEGNGFAIEALETIRRVEAGEPVGEMYVSRLNNWVRSQQAR